MANKNKYSTILEDNYLYISHLDEGFQFWRIPIWPDNISDVMQSSFQSTNALGRTAPVFTFSNSGPRTINISLPMHRDMLDEYNAGVSNVNLDAGEDCADNLIKALQAIALPKYNLQNKAVEPPLVALRLGNEIFIKGVVTSGITVNFTKPILSNGKYAGVEIAFTITEVDPYDATTVFKNGGFRGVVRSMKKNMGLED